MIDTGVFTVRAYTNWDEARRERNAAIDFIVDWKVRSRKWTEREDGNGQSEETLVGFTGLCSRAVSAVRRKEESLRLVGRASCAQS